MRSEILFCEYLIKRKHFCFFMCDEVNERWFLKKGFAEAEVALDDFEAEGVGLYGERLSA